MKGALAYDYVKNDCKINVIECICVSADNSPVKSFKVTINASERFTTTGIIMAREYLCKEMFQT